MTHPFSHLHSFPRPRMVGHHSEKASASHCWVVIGPESSSDQGLFPLSFGLRRDLTQKWVQLPWPVLSRYSSRKLPNCCYRKGPSF